MPNRKNTGKTIKCSKKKGRTINKERSFTFSRALTSATVMESRALKLSLTALASSDGVLGLETLKNEKDIVNSIDQKTTTATLDLIKTTTKTSLFGLLVCLSLSLFILNYRE